MTNPKPFNSWTLCPTPNPDARMRLFCFPYAGGHARLFETWAQYLPPDVEVWAVEYPGRGSRFSEPSHTHISDIVRELSQALLPLTDKSFALFGHSMGALISFEVARELRREHAKTPECLYVSAFAAPQVPRSKTGKHLLSDPDLLEELRQLNGTPEVLLKNAELMELVLPIMRADIQVCETYEYHHEEPFAFPIAVYGGLEDAGIPQADLMEWSKQTQGECRLQMFAGDHFFVHSHRAQLLYCLEGQLLTLLSGLTSSTNEG